MLSLLILHDYCTIQLYRKVAGCNLWPHTIVWEVCGNTLVDECHFQRLDQHRWRLHWDPVSKLYYVMRTERDTHGKHSYVSMAREILGISCKTSSSGDIADHENHDTLDNTLDNLRVATKSQNNANSRNRNLHCSRFKGVGFTGTGFRAKVRYKGKDICFPTLQLEIEAGLMFFYASELLHQKFCYRSDFPTDEIPSEERQKWLHRLVIEKLEQTGLL